MPLASSPERDTFAFRAKSGVEGGGEGGGGERKAKQTLPRTNSSTPLPIGQQIEHTLPPTPILTVLDDHVWFKIRPLANHKGKCGCKMFHDIVVVEVKVPVGRDEREREGGGGGQKTPQRKVSEGIGIQMAATSMRFKL